MKKIIFYYHHFGGYGHGMRILSICKALQAIRNIHIVVINSGREQPELGIDRYAKVVNLPPVFAAESLFQGLRSNGDYDKTMAQRKMVLKKLADKFCPDLAVIEHFPFGRASLESEINGFIDNLKNSNCKIYSSVRDLILTNGKTEYEERFNGIFIHEDSTFNSSEYVPKNSLFTGRVHPYGQIETSSDIGLRERLNFGSKKLIVVSIGGGLDGHELLVKTIRVKSKIDAEYPCRLMVFTGTSFSESRWDELNKNLPPDCELCRFDQDLMDYVQIADLFISMGGYNSINSHLLTDTSSMIFPRLTDKEQSTRAKQYQLDCFDYEKITESELLSAIIGKLSQKIEPKQVVNMKGAQTTARFIVKALDLKRVKIRVKTRCNLNCAMCSWKDMEEQLEEKRICTVLDDFSMLGASVINFTGGEPTTFPGLERVMKYAKDKGFKISLSTNGYNQSPLERLTQYLDYVDISIDSPIEHLNDTIRGRKGSYANAIKSIHYLSGKGIKPHINVTVRPDNYKGLHKLISILFAKISTISYTLVDTTGNKMDDLKFSIDQLVEYYSKEVIEILKNSIKCHIPVRITPFYDHLRGLNSFDVLTDLTENKDKHNLNEIFTLKGRNCQIAKDQIRVNANGNVRPCCYLDDQHVTFGNINHRPLKEIVTDDKYFNYVNQAREGIGDCSVCQLGYVGYKDICLSKV